MSPLADNRRSCCPLACTLDLLGDRWTLLVIRDLFAGRTRFSEFQRAPEKIATNILSDRLSLLVERGLVERQRAPSGKRAVYRLTAKGRTLGPLLAAMRDWGLANIEGTAALIATDTDR